MDDFETHDDRRLLPGTGFTIEPGVYFDDFGVRTEINMIVSARDMHFVSEDGRFVSLLRNDGFGTGHTVEVLDARGTLLAVCKIPQDRKDHTVASVSWKSRTVVLYQRNTRQLTAYDLPELPAP